MNAAHTARTAIYAGSFDPPTNGHLDVVRSACRWRTGWCWRLASIPARPRLHPGRAHGNLLEVCGPVAAEEGTALEVITFDNLVVEAARKAGAGLLIRGLRDGTDLDYEMQMAGMNGTMAPEIQTVFLPASPRVRPHHRHLGAPDRGHGR